jgi:hypothetical protein
LTGITEPVGASAFAGFAEAITLGDTGFKHLSLVEG